MLHTLKMLSLGGPCIEVLDQIITLQLSKRTHAIVNVSTYLVPVPRITIRGLLRYIISIDSNLSILVCLSLTGVVKLELHAALAFH